MFSLKTKIIKPYCKQINSLGYAIIQLPEFLLKIMNYIGKMSNKTSDRSHDEMNNELKCVQKIVKRNHDAIVEDGNTDLMLKMKKFEMRVNRRLKAMELEMKNVLFTQNK